MRATHAPKETAMKLLLLIPLALAGLTGCVAVPYEYADAGYNGGYTGAYSGGTYYSQPAYIYNAPPVHRHGSPPRHRGGGRGDRDRDGIPDRADRDRDGDGVPNRRDRRPGNSRRN